MYFSRMKNAVLQLIRKHICARYLLLPLYLSIVSFTSCQKTSSRVDIVLFDSVPVVKPVLPMINEISGIADSKVNTGFLWGEQDSGNPPAISLIDHSGTVLKSVFIKGAVNRDWEDMALSGTDLYIADIGDNNQVYADYTIYTFPEPVRSTDTVSNFQMIRFQYEDGSHDAEAFIVDPASKDIYLFTKRDNNSRVFKLSFPYSYTTINMAKEVATLPYGGVVSACLSPDGKELLVKTYPAILHYSRAMQESLVQVLGKAYTKVPYKMEPLGEAVTFGADNKGYYTLSEKGFSSNVNLYYYKRK
jgi:hypothetical protein